MAEVAHAAEHHGHAALVGGGDHLVVAHGAAGLDDAGGALVHHHVQAVTEREPGVAEQKVSENLLSSELDIIDQSRFSPTFLNVTGYFNRSKINFT